MAKARKHAQRKRAKSLIGSMQEFLTPEVFKQARNASQRRKSPRWDLHPLLYILVLTTYCCGDSLPEKFELARTFYVASCPKRKRPGKHFSGFEKAVAKLPMSILRALAAAIRGRIEVVFGDRWKVGGFVPLGCDGTRQACPRTEELEKRLGTFGKDGSSPMIWNTSIVHLTLGFPFCWRLGKGGKASERGRVPRRDRLLLAEDAAGGRKAAHSRPIDADPQLPSQGGRVVVYECGGFKEIVPGNGGRLLSLEVGN